MLTRPIRLAGLALVAAAMVAVAPAAQAGQPRPPTHALARTAAGTTPGTPSTMVTGTTAPASPASATVGGPGLAGAGVLADVPSGVPTPPSMKAASYLLADLDTGEVLVAKAPHAPHLPASTLKVLTALTVMPRLDPATVVTAERDDIVDGSLVGIVPGLTYTVHQLLQGMMLSSGNDAATALARVAGGADSVAGTVAAMQQTAEDLGARDTVVRDPSGLDAPDQVTSAYDLALIARAALRDPAFRTLAATERARFPGKPVEAKVAKGSPATATAMSTTSTSTTSTSTTSTSTTSTATTAARRSTFQIQNHNTLLYNYDGAIGVKNGYTVAARWTIVGAAERDGHRYVVTALKRSDRSWRPTAALLDWAFAHGSQVRPVGRLVEPGELAQPTAGTPSTPLAVAAAVAGGATAREAPAPRWVGAAGLGVAAALLASLALRAHRTRLGMLRRAAMPASGAGGPHGRRAGHADHGPRSAGRERRSSP